MNLTVVMIYNTQTQMVRFLTVHCTAFPKQLDCCTQYVLSTGMIYKTKLISTTVASVIKPVLQRMKLLSRQLKAG